MPSQLLTTLRTKEDLDILRGELDILKNALYQSRNMYEDVIHNSIRSWVSEIILKETNRETMEDYIKDLEAELLKLPVLSASINFEPSQTFVELLSNWLKKYVSENIVVDILLNTASIGGIQLSYKGKYLDLSLRKRISAELESFSLTHISNIKS